MNFFVKGKINLSQIKNKKEFLTKLSNAIYCLSKSMVCVNKICVGGRYHKNYYNYLCSGFFDGKNTVFMTKNALKSEFLYNLKQNMCNYGVYFYVLNNEIFIEIYSGNMFLLDVNQQNYIEKYMLYNYTLQCNDNIQYKKITDYYKDKFCKTTLIFKIETENKAFKKFQRLSNQQSKYMVKIQKDLSYEIYFENKKLNYKRYFKNFKLMSGEEIEVINFINLKSKKRVVNDKFLMYNNLTNSFDLVATLYYIEEKITNDKNCTKLV